MKFVFRAAVPSDAAELNRLNAAFNGPVGATDQSIALSIRDNRQEQVFVAEWAGQLVGFCCVQLFKSFCYDRNYAEITELFVAEEHRRKGIGAVLMGYAEGYYSDKNIAGFQLFTSGENTAAQRFYEGRGYAKTEEIMYRKRKAAPNKCLK
jgi:ribosomal protein S18 acetylase RimI-like enzyme